MNGCNRVNFTFLLFHIVLYLIGKASFCPRLRQVGMTYVALHKVRMRLYREKEFFKSIHYLLCENITNLQTITKISTFYNVSLEV